MPCPLCRSIGRVHIPVEAQFNAWLISRAQCGCFSCARDWWKWGWEDIT